MQELDEILVNLPAGFRARIGLNETPLTQALARGEFGEAESIILNATDPEFLNDGALAATPLNMVLTGRSSYYHQSRNLKLAQLLLEKGANPNLRIPNHDMESASQSPLELLLRYYLKLIQVFGLPGSCRVQSYSTNSFEETELMDTIGLNGETSELGPAQVTCQARRLLEICLDCGGDPNLPTTDAAKTIFHMALTAPSLDLGLVERLLQTGVNVNIADVHNTTPIMDVINLGDEARSVSSLSVLESSSQAVILQLENCSRQSAVWRAVFQGHRDLARSLESRWPAGRGPTSSAARVEPVCPARRSYRHSSIKTLVPAILAPLLSDSPCYANLHVNTARRRQPQLRFSSELTNHGLRSQILILILTGIFLVVRLHLAPHVDSGELQGEGGEVNSRVASLVSSQTEHSCAGDSSVVDSGSLLPLMFGQLTSGLRQLAVRTILSSILFNCPPELANKRLDEVCETQGFMLTQLLVKPSLSKPKLAGEGLLSYEYEIELGNEMEVSFGRRDGDTEGGPGSESVEIAVSDRSSSHTPASPPSFSELDESASELMETIAKLDRELETIKTECVLDSLDRDLAIWESELVATLDRIQTCHAELGSLHTLQQARRRSEELMEELRLQRKLIESSSKDIEDVETSLADLDIGGAGAESVDLTRRMLDDNWSLGAARFIAEADVGGAASVESLSPCVEEVEVVEEVGEVEDSSPGSIREYRETLVQTLTVDATYSQDGRPEGTEEGRLRIPRLVQSDLSSSDSEDSVSVSSSESDTWGGTFSLRHTRPSQSDPGEQAGSSQASIVARLSPRTLFALTDHLGIPHSLRPVFSVEAARLQLCLALHSHRSISCDRNCEGEESDTEDSETEDWLHSDTDSDDNLEEPDIVPHLTDSDSDHSDDDDDIDDGLSSGSSLSNFSQRSWYGSLSQITEGRQLTPLSTPPALTQSEDSDSEEEPAGAWLEDREDLRRVRQFLQSGPGPDFSHSTDSESLSE